MSIIGLQRRLAQVGRIRWGVKTGKAMKAIDKFRLTSPSEDLIRAAAEVYGGTPQPWSPKEGAPGEWEVITDSPELDIAIPPMAEPYSQHMEQWTGGGCKVRCNRETAIVAEGGEFVERPCMCERGSEKCDAITRFNVLLPRLPGIGVWRADTKSWNAAEKIPGALDVLAGRAMQGEFIEAKLRLVHESKSVPGQTPKRWVEPVIDIPGTLGELMAGMVDGPRLISAPTVKALPEPEPPPLPADPTFNEHKHSDVGTVVVEAPKTVPSNVFFGKAKAINPDMDAIRRVVMDVRGVESTKGITEDEAEEVYARLQAPSVDEIALDVFGPGVEVVKEDPHA